MIQTKLQRNNWGVVGHILLGIIGVTGVVFLLWNTRSLWRGPRITIITPIPGAEIKTMPFTITGSTDGVDTLQINGRSVVLNPAGEFTTREIVPDGYSEIVISGTDTQNRTKTVLIPVYHPPVAREIPDPETVPAEIVEPTRTPESPASPQ